MDEIRYEKQLPPLLSGQALIDAISYYPEYDPTIRDAEQYERLEMLADIYKVFYPFPMAIEIYNKLHLATTLSLKKKNTKLAVQQRNETYKAMFGAGQYHGIIGGADSMTIIGTSGIGKSSAIQTSLGLISDGKIIETANPYSKIIQCLQVQCPYDSSPKGLLLEILRNVDDIIGTRYNERSRKSSDTTDVLIGTVSQVALNHIGLLVIDEIQNVWGRKNGTMLMSMIIQLINSSGISICMVGTSECIPFFESTVQLSRRSHGLKYDVMSYNDDFEAFCTKLWEYQYCKEYTPINVTMVDWLYQHSGGIIANVVSLIHDAQEIAILEGDEKLDLVSLEKAYRSRMGFIHRFIDTSKQIKHPVVSKKEEYFEEKDGELEEYLTLEEMATIGKKKGFDPLEYLMKRICVEEVTV